MTSKPKINIKKITLEEIAKNLYFYKAHVLYVHDGDTVTILIDLGIDTFRKIKLRLYGINTPEIIGSEKAKGLKSKTYTSNKILMKEVYVQTIKDKTEKYGRYLANVWVLNANKKEYDCLNDMLLKNNLAEVLLY